MLLNLFGKSFFLPLFLYAVSFRPMLLLLLNLLEINMSTLSARPANVLIKTCSDSSLFGSCNVRPAKSKFARARLSVYVCVRVFCLSVFFAGILLSGTGRASNSSTIV